ncbi:MAG: hypothetical protein IJL71_04100 [Oscillospiraceae bacterium]|nr:hypothetical protein [Oscillospiraceae bacterium]
MNKAVIRKLSLLIAVCSCLFLLSACNSDRPTKREREIAILVRYVGDNDDPYDNIVEVNVLHEDVSEDEIYQLDLNGKGYVGHSLATIIPAEPFDPSQTIIVAEKIYLLRN